MTNMTKNIDFQKEFPLNFPQKRMKIFELGAEFTSVDERIFTPLKHFRVCQMLLTKLRVVKEKHAIYSN
jgi:hypothetical protein